MKNKCFIIIPLCTAALIGILFVSVYAATAGSKIDLNSTANSGGEVIDINNQAVETSEYNNKIKIQQIAKAYKNEGKFISDEQLQRLENLQDSQKITPALERLPYQEGIIIGEVDPNEPKLDLATAKDIIVKCNNFEEILSEFEKVQKYADSVGGSGITWISYQLNEYEDITIIFEQKEIFYSVFNQDGTVKLTELLFG